MCSFLFTLSYFCVFTNLRLLSQCRCSPGRPKVRSCFHFLIQCHRLQLHRLHNIVFAVHPVISQVSLTYLILLSTILLHLISAALNHNVLCTRLFWHEPGTAISCPRLTSLPYLFILHTTALVHPYSPSSITCRPLTAQPRASSAPTVLFYAVLPCFISSCSCWEPLTPPFRLDCFRYVVLLLCYCRSLNEV